jgi:hypothetical protein
MTTTRTKYREAIEQRVGKESGQKWPAYAWPGGYAIAYLCADGESLCADCMDTQPVTFGSGVNPMDAQWEVCGVFAYGADTDYPETDEHCAHCNRVICEGIES